jgi:hypothetical protein
MLRIVPHGSIALKKPETMNVRAKVMRQKCER